MMNYEEALSFIHSINSLFCNPGLERTKALCEALGNPQDDLKFIHIAGTNGKGSTSSMLSSVLTAAGYKVGLYTSPFILKFNERIRVDGKEISDLELAKITDIVRPIAEKMEDKPTEFELITAIAFYYFRMCGCDVVVLECGLGGRYDATNVINTSLLSLITGISLDHTAILGDTIEKIAGEKAGIIKRGTPVIFGGNDLSALSVIKKEAEKSGSPLYTVDHEKLHIKKSDLSGTILDFLDYNSIEIGLLGAYQPKNAAMVISAVNELKKLGLRIPDDAVYQGMKSAKWAARFEIIHENPRIIFDGAHNAEGIRAAKQSIEGYFGNEKVIVISGVLKDKDYQKIAEDIASVSDKVFTITPENPRALSAEQYAEVIREKGATATAEGNIASALKSAIDEANECKRSIVILGSLYTYGDVIKEINKQKEK